MYRPIVYVCQGRKCARACAHEALLRSLCKVADVRLVRCQKVCHGSVIISELDGKLEWFERVDRPRLCIMAKEAVRTGRRKALAKKLKNRRLKQLAGRQPRR